jgi:archaemetzincin
VRPLTRRSLLVGLSCAAATACHRSHPTGASSPAARLVARPSTPAATASTPEWLHALGPLDDLPRADRRAFTDAVGFESLPPPGDCDWRTLRPELPQDVAAYVASGPNPLWAPRDRIALLPRGHFPFDVVDDGALVGLVRTPELADVAALVSAFFGVPTDVLEREDLDADRLPSREHDGHRQIHAPSMLDAVRPVLPATAYAMLALVNLDLYVWPEQQFGFGYSTYTDRVGVVGFARFDPAFSGAERPADLWRAIVARSLRVVAHEVGHLFGLAHCQHFRCVLNGVADLRELDALPLHLCPLCLRKLNLVAGLDPAARYAELVPLFERLRLDEEHEWTRRRAARLRQA